MIRLILALLFTLIVAVLPFVLLAAYLVWMVRAWRRGRKGLFWSQTAVAAAAVAALGFLMDLTPASHAYWDRRQTEALTGIPFPFGKRVYRYDSERAFNGDGYSILVVELTPEVARYFHSPPAGFFANYPHKPDVRSRWQAVHWRTGPARADEQKFIDFALGENAPNEQPLLDKAFASARRSLAKPTACYAYCYLQNGKNVSDIDFFLIDPEERRLYIINSNT